MRILCLGEALVDVVGEPPGPLVAHFGGDVANAAVNAARLGGDVALAGGAGDDTWGAWLRDRLAAEGVGMQWFELLDSVRTKLAFVRVDSGGEPSFDFYGDGVAPAGVPEALGACDALFLTSNTLLGEQERMLGLTARRQALDEGKPVVFDANLRPARWATADAAVATVQGCVPGTAVLKCNRSEARALTGRDDPHAAAGALLELGAQSVVVTLGADGALLRGAGGDAHVPGVPATPVDTTGAGDAFTGALAAALGSGCDLVAAVRIGVRAGTYAVCRPGAQASFPRAAEIGVPPLYKRP
jgi:sugar/nucleoside kinase (ribokinase family)